jgi:hypothetical protein
MATSALVDNKDIEIGRRIITALTRAGIGVNVAFWAHIPQISEWQLFIGTPLVDSRGEKSAYKEVLRTLRSEGFDSDLPWRRIFLRSPKDRVLKSLERQGKNSPSEGFRALNAAVGDRFIEDVFLYSGSIDIDEIAPHEYRVMYTPIPGGGSVPWLPVHGIDRLRGLLADIRVPRYLIDEALAHLRRQGSIAVPNISLSKSELKKVGLA